MQRGPGYEGDLLMLLVGGLVKGGGKSQLLQSCQLVQ